MTLDAVARLIIDEAVPLSGRVLVWGDADGALARAALEAGCDVRAFCDDLRDAEALPDGTALDSPTDPWVASADIVLARLPAGLGELDDLCAAVAGPAASESLRLVAGARVKHMIPTQNEVLRRWFGDVRASLGRDKCRVLHAAAPTGAEPRWPRAASVDGLTVWAYGGVFAANRLDAGTRLLLDALTDAGVVTRGAGAGASNDRGRRALDLGSGSGIVATLLARSGWRTTASDVSWAATESTRLTAAANSLDVQIERRDGLIGVPPGSYDLIATNPPFHRGAAKDSTPTLDAIAAAGEALASGGEFWCVYNSHLPYLRALASAVGPTQIAARDRHYTVVKATRP